MEIVKTKSKTTETYKKQESIRWKILEILELKEGYQALAGEHTHIHTVSPRKIRHTTNLMNSILEDKRSREVRSSLGSVFSTNHHSNCS